MFTRTQELRPAFLALQNLRASEIMMYSPARFFVSALAEATPSKIFFLDRLNIDTENLKGH